MIKYKCLASEVVEDKDNQVHSWVNLTPDEVFVSNMTWVQLHSVDATHAHPSLQKYAGKRVRVTVEILD